MIGMIIRRLAIGLLVMWGAATLIFVIIRVAPGDPAAVLLGPDAEPGQIARLRAELGLDQPIFVQYGNYLLDTVRLDFGDSYRLRMPAIEAVFDRLPATIELTLTSTALAVVVGLTLGILAGMRPNTWTDRIVSGLTTMLQSFPTFWIGIMLILIFALWLRLTPSAGTGTPLHMVLPAVTLAFPFVAIVARVTRSSLVENMGEAYLDTAYAKGLTLRQAVLGHALKNSLIPVITVIGLHIGALLGGAVVVENVFAWPGLGTLMVEAVGNRDYTVVQAATLIVAGVIVLLNLATDLVYRVLDPRIRTGRTS
ncbi:peptide/nickel transport system permease protein [Microlunatus parietis]|uniref:Peptide/nickel transport system permease protein n=2 Tax=Microlunatus parietis TaxID=682979 RepID=A0A7Y9I8H1_9ACTN|nr:peptide/nickel transport system permease protein [Microlunatus parietis]